MFYLKKLSASWLLCCVDSMLHLCSVVQSHRFLSDTFLVIAPLTSCMSFVHLCKADSFTILLLLPLLYVKCGMHLICCINIRLILEKYASLAYGQKLLLLTLIFFSHCHCDAYLLACHSASSERKTTHSSAQLEPCFNPSGVFGDVAKYRHSLERCWFIWNNKRVIHERSDSR